MKMSEWTGWKGWVRDIGTAALIGVLILIFLKPTIVQEHSMEGTLHENDYLFISRQAYNLFGEPEYGDIVVFHSNLTRSNGSEKLLIKRIIGLAGDTISVHDGAVYRNGEALDEPYTKDGTTLGEMEEITVPANSFFAMGDNRQNSVDSRSSAVGCIPVSAIMGKAVIRVFPFNKITIFK